MSRLGRLASVRNVSRGRLLVVLTVLVVAASVAVLVLALTKPEPRDDVVRGPGIDASGRYVPADLAAPAGPALRAAVTTAREALSYDYRSLDRGLKAAQAGMTAPFAQKFAAALPALSRPYVRRKQIVVAEVTGAGVVRVDGSRAVRCLVFVDQRTVTGARPAGRRAGPSLRVVVDVVSDAGDGGDGGTWLVSNIAPVS